MEQHGIYHTHAGDLDLMFETNKSILHSYHLSHLYTGAQTDQSSFNMYQKNKQNITNIEYTSYTSVWTNTNHRL